MKKIAFFVSIMIMGLLCSCGGNKASNPSSTVTGESTMQSDNDIYGDSNSPVQGLSTVGTKEIEVMGNNLTVPDSAFIIGPDHEEYPIKSDDLEVIKNTVYLVFEDDKDDKQVKWRNQLIIQRTKDVNATEPITWEQARTVLQYHADAFTQVNPSFHNLVKEDVDLTQSPSVHCTADNEENNATYDLWFFMNNHHDVITFFFIHSNKASADFTSEVDKMVRSIHIGGLDGDGAFKSSIESDNDKSDDSNKTSFTNKYGTPTTKCAHAGCNNYIAKSGDTNCCERHSNKCAECGKYIDEDAMYCMDCLEKALSN